VITPELWAGPASKPDGGAAFLGPYTSRHPVNDRTIQTYEINSLADGIRRRQLFAITRDGAALGRVLDKMSGVPERRFERDVVFPLGQWEQGERREFEAVEHTLFGPALRRITLEILQIDYIHDGIANSLRYRLTVRDEANRVLNCEVAVFSPGHGQVVSEVNGIWQGCHACPCPG
jgi:hypothetical protein